MYASWEAKAYPRLAQTSKMVRFVAIVNRFQPLIIVAKISILMFA